MLLPFLVRYLAESNILINDVPGPVSSQHLHFYVRSSRSLIQLRKPQLIRHIRAVTRVDNVQLRARDRDRSRPIQVQLAFLGILLVGCRKVEQHTQSDINREYRLRFYEQYQGIPHLKTDIVIHPRCQYILQSHQFAIRFCYSGILRVES